MKLSASLSLALIILVCGPATAQTSLESAIRTLQDNIRIREEVDRDTKTSRTLRLLNRRSLEEKRAELRTFVQLRITQLENYLKRADGSALAQVQDAQKSLSYLKSISDGVNPPPAKASNSASMSATRSRIVGEARSDSSVQPFLNNERRELRLTLDPPHAGDTEISGRSPANISEIVIQVRTQARPSSGAAFAHRIGTAKDLITYRVVRPNRHTPDRDGWLFTVALSGPLTPGQEVRALSSAEGTQWTSVSDSVELPVANSISSTAVSTPTQRRGDGYLPPVPQDLSYADPCAGKPNLRMIRVHWDTGKVFPSRLKHSGPYCIEIVGANTILYSYLIDVESVSPSGNPFDALAAAIDVVKEGFTKKAAAPEGAEPLGGVCTLAAAVDEVKDRATKLDTALTGILPPEEGGKYKSVSLAETRTAFNIVRGRFTDFHTKVEELRAKLNGPTPNCTAAQRAEARELVRDGRDVEIKYEALRARVDSPPPARAYEELEETDQTKITVREMFRHQPTTANAVTVNIAPAYPLISASAGALITQVPARSYHNRVAPDPANPTATQTILSVDNTSGTRPALTALLHYNLPFIQKRRLGLAISGGPVYDISGGKGDTSKLGLFGGVSLRFSEWLYLTPGFHIGEFADFPEGLRAGQVVPSNISEPVPVKRYTTRFAFGLTFKVKDLGQSQPSQ